jgi:hypothetical protein
MKAPFISFHIFTNHGSSQKEWGFGFGIGWKDYGTFREWFFSPPFFKIENAP